MNRIMVMQHGDAAGLLADVHGLRRLCGFCYDSSLAITSLLFNLAILVLGYPRSFLGELAV